MLTLVLTLAALTTQASDPAADLAAAVALPTPTERRAAADKLAKQPGIDLATWLDITSHFGQFEDQEPGTQNLTVELPVLGKTETTDLAVFVPKTYNAATPAPLLLVLHGTGGRGRDALEGWRAVSEGLGALILAPTDPGLNQGYAFSEQERAGTLAALRWMRLHYNVDERRILATGVSRGGHLTWDLALRHPGLFAAIVPIVGGPRLSLTRGQNNLRYIRNVVSTPIRDLQGAKDDPLLILNLGLAFERLEDLDATDAKYIEFPELGHDYDPGAVDWRAFLSLARSEPWPAKTLLSSAAADDAGRTFLRIEKLDKQVAPDFQLKVTNAWNRADDLGKRRIMQTAAEKHTGHLEISSTKPGSYKAKGEGVKSFRLLLDAAHLDQKGRAAVRFGSRTTKKTPEPSAKVLLEEFVESFDRGFLPTVEVLVP